MCQTSVYRIWEHLTRQAILAFFRRHAMRTPVLSKSLLDKLRTDFGVWSGGFAPESPYQITVYLDYAISVKMPPELADRVLSYWMNHPDYFERCFDQHDQMRDA